MALELFVVLLRMSAVVLFNCGLLVDVLDAAAGLALVWPCPPSSSEAYV